MKRRIAGMILAFVMVLPLTTASAGAGGADAKEISLNSLPKSAELVALLNWFFPFHGSEFNSGAIASAEENVFENMISMPVEDYSWGEYTGPWNDYPGTSSKRVWGPADGPSDPLNRWTSYASSDKVRIGWIMRNVLNCSQSDLDTLIARWKKDPSNGYEHDGRYYVPFDPDSVGEAAWDIVLRSAKYVGSVYYIEYDDYYGPLMEDMEQFHREWFNQHCYATLVLKEINGKQYWSIYAISGKGFVPYSSVGGFYDVQADDWFALPVLWAVENNITNGTGSNQFSPDATCTTAQILTFLWRAAGSPEPGIRNPFADVSSSDYFYQAAVWASEKGLVTGSRFGGGAPCTRSATVTYLWKLSGSPAAGSSAFGDVPAGAPYSSAVAWAVEKGVTSGTGNNRFSPNETCTRGQIVTFLYRWKHP